ncbi:nickel/cobalt transporter [Orrella marina]|nr:nickel/cobalt transporter [Orrella marina]
MLQNRSLSYSALAASLLTVLLITLAGTGMAQSQHPFAIAEQTVSTTSWFGLDQITAQISDLQSRFYRQLTSAVRAWQENPWNAWLLLTLSFAYGVFHALGPGHGKAVLAGYVLANRETLRNAATLSMIASIVQALVAIGLVGLAAGVLNLTGAMLTQITGWLELGAYALLTALGIWLVCKHVVRVVWSAIVSRMRDSALHRHAHDHHEHNLGDAGNCSSCSHTHLPAPEMVSGQLNLSKAIAAIIAIGLRPCSGAILVLVFALSQQMFWAGAGAALAMGLGTGITVATLAMGSVGARALTETATGARHQRAGRILGLMIQGGASIMVLTFGLLLLLATWRYGVSS